ncbi:MAG: hypothetical protein WAW16_08660 [Candidatus Cryosericum sp.]
MSILVRTIHGRQYAYSSRREGKRMIQTYLGPMSRPDVQAAVDSLSEEKGISMRLRRLFWDTDPELLDSSLHAAAIIERVLELGDLQDVRWLQHRYTGTAIAQVLTLSRGLSPRSRTFWNLWFVREVPCAS